MSHGLPGAPEGPQDHRPLPTEWQKTIDSFLEFRRVHRGVSAGTLTRYRGLLLPFARHVSPPTQQVGLHAIAAHHVDDFIVQLARSHSRDWAKHASSTIRAFLRYLAMLGHVPAELAAQVPYPRTYRLAGLPRALDPKDLKRVLRSVRRSVRGGRREYAILMIFATYGLRVGDVASLRLDDIRWRDASIAIMVAKTGRPLVLPLTDAVGDAIADYLQRERGQCDRRELFLALQKPFVPLTAPCISTLVGQAMRRVGVKLPHVTSHAFRHGFATRLVRNGVAIDTVASCLGHASSESTLIYTKLNIEDLRSVSLDPREAIQ